MGFDKKNVKRKRVPVFGVWKGSLPQGAPACPWIRIAKLPSCTFANSSVVVDEDVVKSCKEVKFTRKIFNDRYTMYALKAQPDILT